MGLRLLFMLTATAMQRVVDRMQFRCFPKDRACQHRMRCPVLVAGSRASPELLIILRWLRCCACEAPSLQQEPACAPQSVEVTKLLAVVATLLTACAFIAWTIISSVWVSRKQACTGARHWACWGLFRG